MPRPRVHTSGPLARGQELTLEAGPGQHLLRVLRLRPGDPVWLFDGSGAEFAGELLPATAAARVRVLERSRQEPPPALALCLWLGISKGERMDFALQKAVELGVTGLRPVFAGRSVVQLDGARLQRRTEHWQAVIIAACEQSGRCRLPELLPAMPLATALNQPPGEPGADLRLVLHPGADTALPRLPPPRRGVELLVGPEGGLAEAELALARERGFRPVRLGPRVLRTETAPLAALAAIQALWGDFRDG
jgi:16S rRNA (uracil1498-N3)-methyltransferase